jgi:large subunit ribosomal protein L25
MDMQELTIARRDGTGKQMAKRLRREGRVPAIIYGGAAPEPVTVDPRAVLRIIHGHEGTTQLLTLKAEGSDNGTTRMAVIRELQFHPVSEALLHVDLQEVSADRAITVRVAVHPVGEAVGVKDQKGILNLVLHELTISTLPTQIPQRIDVDVTPLHIGEVLTVADLQVPEGVKVLNDRGQAIVTVSAPMAEEAPVAAVATAAATTEPEVLTERKPKEGEEAAAKGDDKKPAKK